MKWEGHELAVLGTLTGCYGIVGATLGPGWIRKFVHQQPVAAMSVALASAAVAMPLVIVPIRRTLKFPTNQYDASHPNVVFPKYD
eukprot:CAMPEP_0116826706 /NCGR_PEP_ID=MMETSP0418-20121206/2679_1 /TAXON_ID=1158023 /ORGANISM="Astrosyne radiata, Strain 13vi08-1A" /LENGTH=84 /DNA_ID=CAMNT_0004455373 /DNA_START=98 /DNA_END=352 /DNA_ORIENTATION=-